MGYNTKNALFLREIKKYYEYYKLENGYGV
ncbi:hypothetical protein L1275_000022 [Flavobacterium sp. HSC-61S13]|nr:hypothetical protein [Flavobacterium sp. HSC-61S13]